MSEIRLQIRCTKDEKAFFQLAAKLSGFKSLSEYMRVAAFEAIKRDWPSMSQKYHEGKDKPLEQPIIDVNEDKLL